MKIKLIKLIVVVVAISWLTSCVTLSKDEKIDTRLPKPVFLAINATAPYSGWLVHEDFLMPIVKEAGR